MPTLVRDPQPAEFEALLERRRRLGQDLFDEVWEGVLHMTRSPQSARPGRVAARRDPFAAGGGAGLRALGQLNLGGERDCRVPDGGLVRPGPDGVYLSTARLVVEIVSPGDESWAKLDFYAARGLEELVIVDPQEKTVSWVGLEGGEYRHVKRSRVIELGAGELARLIDWP